MQPKPFLTIATMSIVCVFAMGNLCFGQSYWKKTYGGAEQDYITTITPTADGNFLVGGQTYARGAGGWSWDIWLLKINPAGDTLWTKTYGDTGSEFLAAIIPAADGYFLLANNDYANEGSQLVKINLTGDTQWTKRFRGTCREIIPAADGNFLIAGFVYPPNMQDADTWVVKIKPNGDTLWTKFFGGMKDDKIQHILPADNGNFLMEVLTAHFGESEKTIWLLKIDSNGDTLWTKTLTSKGSDEDFCSIVSAADGNFLVWASVFSYGKTAEDMWLMKINPNGDILWTKTLIIRGITVYPKVMPIDGNNFLLGGAIFPEGVAGSGADMWLNKIDSNGDIVWTKTYGEKKDDRIDMLLPTTDGNVLLAGPSLSYGGGDEDILLMKITAQGDAVWKKVIGGSPNRDYPTTIIPTDDGDFLLGGKSFFPDAGNDDALLVRIIADRYARKDSLFTYKIPTYGIDTPNVGFSPLKTPSGMTVSAGGIVSWTPQTDSAYMERVEFLVVNDVGRKDTLTFNIFINTNHQTIPSSIGPSRKNKTELKQSEIVTTSLSGKVAFALPASAASLRIYDVNGRTVDKITPIASGSGANAVRPGTSTGCARVPSGKYFAKVNIGKNYVVKPFLLVR